MSREPKTNEPADANKADATEPKTNEPADAKDEKAPEVSEGFVALKPPDGTGPGDGVTCGGDKPRAYKVGKDGYLRVLADHVCQLVRMYGFTPAPRIDAAERLAK